jgi:NADPH-dependent 2,4-dienoyl-CoA reductase/sulfur reductase-like enzyme
VRQVRSQIGCARLTQVPAMVKLFYSFSKQLRTPHVEYMNLRAPDSRHDHCMMFQALCALAVFACISALRVDACKVAVIGGGIGGTGAAYYLSKSRPACQIAL